MKYENEYINILKHELIPVNGCTEPVSLAYAASLGRKYLGEVPTEVTVYASRSIIKNVKAVVVPNTNGLKGVKAAVALGIVGGNPDKELLCISEVSQENIRNCRDFLNNIPINVKMSDSKLIFDIHIILKGKDNNCEIRIVDNHDNVVLIKRNDEVILEKEIVGIEKIDLTDKSILTVENIYNFVTTVDLEKVDVIVKNRKLITDDSLFNRFKEFTSDIVSYQQKEYKLGEILAKIALEKLENGTDADWRKLKPLYIQPPPVFGR